MKQELDSTPSISVFHDFHKPPYGGGNQFMIALTSELERRGMKIERNKLSHTTIACLFNSFNFNFDELLNKSKFSDSVRMVHRVDGPVDKYRGDDRGIDREIWQLNNKIANTTIFQSNYSLHSHKILGMDFVDPVVISNTVDPLIFFPSNSTNVTKYF